jgi:hypothetical protein
MEVWNVDIFVDVIACEDGAEEIIASVMAERNEAGEYHLRRFLDLSICPELILADSDGRHRVTAIDILRVPGKIALQTEQETEEIGCQRAM